MKGVFYMMGILMVIILMIIIQMMVIQIASSFLSLASRILLMS